MKNRITCALIILALAISGFCVALPVAKPANASTNGHTRAEAVAWANSQCGTTHGNGQCVFFVRDYYAYLGQAQPTGNANQYDNGGQYTPAGWSYKSSPQPGDIAVWNTGQYGHVAIVTEIRGAQMVCVEANYSGNPRVTPNLHNIDAATYIRPDFAPDVSHNPIICLDRAECKSPGTVHIRGWAYDPDNKGANLSVDVYAWVGDKPYAFKRIIANKSRPDVNKHPQYAGCGNNHGFDETVCATISGKVKINVAAINVGQGDHSWSESKSVTITKDTTKPSVSNVKVTNVNSTGYTVTCDVSDNAGIKEVSFPTWTGPKGQDDIVWHIASVSKGKASYRIKTSEHGWQSNCKYYTDIYVGDYMGNVSVLNTDKNAPRVKVPSPISNIKITNVNSSGYTVTCDVDSAWKATSIFFPTWTTKNGQDDLIWHQGTLSNGKGTYRVLSKNHDNAKCEEYMTHIYVNNSSGKSNSASAGTIVNHTIVKVPGKVATTSAAGNIEYWKCSVCGKLFKDSAGKKVIAKADTVIPKLSTKSAKKVIKPNTSAAKGKTIKMEVYDYIIKKGNTVYCCCIPGMYKVKLKNGKVKSSKRLMESDEDLWYGNMKLKGKYLFFMGEHSVYRVNTKKGKPKELRKKHFYDWYGYAIKGKKVYLGAEDENTGKRDFFVMKVNGKSLKRTSVIPKMIEKKRNTKKYSIIGGHKKGYWVAYLKTPKGKFKIGQCETDSGE